MIHISCSKGKGLHLLAQNTIPCSPDYKTGPIVIVY